MTETLTKQDLPPCPCCGATDYRVALRNVRDYISGEAFNIFRCRHCTLGIIDPMPNDQEMGRYYPPRYRVNRHAGTGGMRVKLRARALEQRFPRAFRGKLLDIGGGDAAFGLLMRQRGWEVSVTEMDAEVVSKLCRLGLDAHVPEAAAALHWAGRFDAITCWHVLEHVNRPAEMLRWVRGILAPQGVFQVTVPDSESWQARVGGRCWLHLDVPRHRYHFSRRTLETLLVGADLPPLTWTNFALEYDWFGAIQTILNGICTRPNVLFEMMTKPKRRTLGSAELTDQTGGTVAVPPRSAPLALRDVITSISLALPIATLTLPLCLTEWITGGGATLTATCRLNERHFPSGPHVGGTGDRCGRMK